MRRHLLLVLTSLAWCVVAVWIAGCPATTTLGVAPITGVNIPIAPLLNDSSLGCGTGPDDVYMFSVVVAYAATPEGFPSIDSCPEVVLAGGVFPCFADGTFGNLPLEEAGGQLLDSGGALPDGGSVTIWAWVAFYNQETFDRLGGMSAIQTAASPKYSRSICQLGATWTWTCAATEQDNISASCHNPAPIVLGNFPPPTDAAIEAAPTDATPRDAAREASPDAAGDAPSEASEAAPQDASEGG